MILSNIEEAGVTDQQILKSVVVYVTGDCTGQVTHAQGQRELGLVVLILERRLTIRLICCNRRGRIQLGVDSTCCHIFAIKNVARDGRTAAYVGSTEDNNIVELRIIGVADPIQHMHLDAFISLYDTMVCDRRILKAGSVLAKLLYVLEKRAFTAATSVIVDTPENAQHYSELFQLPVSKFVPVPLSIPPLIPSITPADGKLVGRLRRVFIGTFVPLQGVGTIVEAISLLGQDPGIDFVFVGDGQDASCLQNHIETSTVGNVTWHRGHFSTAFVVQQIASADLCLGVFGEGPKTQRVLPYKIYYYLALTKPVLTASTAVTDRISKQCQELGELEPLAVVPAGDPRSLANALLQLRDDPARFASLGRAGGDYYRRALSEMVIEQSLQELLAITRSS